MVARKSLTKINDDLEFFQHQVDGVRWGAKHPSFILADEMGLGKTIQALTVGAVDFDRDKAHTILCVVPAFLLGNWLEEIEEHTQFKAMILAGSPTYRHAVLAGFRNSGFDIMIIGYETLVNDQDYVNAVGWDIVIVDEAHYIKSPSSKRSKAVRKLRRSRGFALTGSPMLNRPDELWALLNFADPHRFTNRWTFRNRYCVLGGFKMKQIVGVKNRAELRGILDEYMLRRLKKDCLDLPDKQVLRIKIDLHPEQAKAYEQMDHELSLIIPDDPDPMQAENILVQMLRLKQLAGSPAVFGLPDDSYKLDRCIEMLTEFTDVTNDDHGPVVVWTQFRGIQDVMAARLAKAGIPYYQIHGDVKKLDRQKVVQAWRATKGSAKPAVLMIMLQMGMGWNLTEANKAIFIDSLYVPKLNEQAEDRIHRIGASTTQPVQIYYLIARGTVEERIEAILRAKRKLFNELIESDPDWKAKLMAELKNQAKPIRGTT